MANLQETGVWEEGIYQLETSDPVMGGANGVDNKPLRQLANRTGYLKKKLEEYKPEAASTTNAGIVQLSSATDSNSEERAATPKAVKEAYDKAVESAGKGLPVGAVIGFPRAIASQEGYLKADGSTFNQSTYPDLYRVLGGNKLPKLTRSDIGMTAYFAFDDIPDGWIKYDEIAAKVTQAAYPELYRKLVAQYGSIDAVPKAEDRFIRNAAGGLAVGTQQGDAIRNITGSIDSGTDQNRQLFDDVTASGALAVSKRGWKRWTGDSNDGYNVPTAFDFDASRVVPVAAENRPKALAMVLCIKAQNSLDDVVMWIKAYGKVTNAGVLDASTLAADLQRKANRDDVAPKSHTHRAAEITDFAEAAAALTVHQKIGTFDICRLPDGTQIESGTVRIQNHNNNPTARVLTWPLAFVDDPVVVATVSAPEGNVRDTWVTIDSRQSNRSAVRYWLFEPSYNAMDVTINFVAVGRWK